MFIFKKPSTSPGLRHKLIISSFLLNNKKLKILKSLHKSGKGVDLKGHLVARRKGGTPRKHSIITIDYKRVNLPNLGLVINLVKSFKKTCLIALVKYSTGSFSYILAPDGFEPGVFVKTVFRPMAFALKYRLGYMVLLKYLEPHTLIFNLETKVNKGGKYCLAAGTSAILLVVDEFSNQALIQLPTGTKLWVNVHCTAVLGRASNPHQFTSILGKAGLSCRLNLRPVVRGVAKNPVDHPHGGRTKTNCPEVTPWNKIAKKGK